jgi:hypothetical protein
MKANGNEKNTEAGKNHNQTNFWFNFLSKKYIKKSSGAPGATFNLSAQHSLSSKVLMKKFNVMVDKDMNSLALCSIQQQHIIIIDVEKKSSSGIFIRSITISCLHRLVYLRFIVHKNSIFFFRTKSIFCL